MTRDPIIRPTDFARDLGCSLRTVYRMAARGEIPPPIKISERVSGWRASTRDQIIADREAGRKVTLAP